MIEHIRKLQQKPETVRRQILFVATFSITAIIFVLWIYSLQDRFETERAETGPKPFALFRQSFDRVRDATEANTAIFVTE